MGLGIAIKVGGAVDADLANATFVEVTERMGETTTYRIRYDFDVSGGDFPLLADGRIDAGSELAVLETVAGSDFCLVQGPVTSHEIHIAHSGAGSWIVVCGMDSTIKMDRESKADVRNDVTDSDAITSIVGTYSLTADIDSTAAHHSAEKHSLVQRDTDLQFVRRLARRNGFLFWITTDTDGTETAHCKRPQLDGNDGPELVINLADNNLQWFDLDWDIERPSSATASELNLNDGSIIDGSVTASPLNALGTQSLVSISSETRSLRIVAPVDDAGDLKSRSEGALIDAGWFIRARCETTASTLQALVRAHTVVNLRGLGSRHSGKYFVAAVRHVIDAAEHRMEMELVRNGWGN